MSLRKTRKKKNINKNIFNRKDYFNQKDNIISFHHPN